METSLTVKGNGMKFSTNNLHHGAKFQIYWKKIAKFQKMLPILGKVMTFSTNLKHKLGIS